MEENKKEISAEMEKALEKLENADLKHNPLGAVPEELLIKALKLLEAHVQVKKF